MTAVRRAKTLKGTMLMAEEEKRKASPACTLKSGFESFSAFYAQFRKPAGASPKEYREGRAQREDAP